MVQRILMMQDRHGVPNSAGAREPGRPVAAWFAGRISFTAYQSLAERLAWEVSEPRGRCPTLLVCELEPAITIGRLGSRIDVALSDDDLRARRLELKFTGRGGGAVPHVPGQVFVALFAALADLGLGAHDAGGLLQRFERGVADALAQIRCGTVRVPGVPGVFGRTGLLAAVGLAVRRSVAVRDGSIAVPFLNELEYRDGIVWANVYRSDRIALIDPASGRVRGWLDMARLRSRLDGQGEVLNGIARDPVTGHMAVTGKLWPRLFAIRLAGKVPA